MEKDTNISINTKNSLDSSKIVTSNNAMNNKISTKSLDSSNVNTFNNTKNNKITKDISTSTNSSDSSDVNTSSKSLDRNKALDIALFDRDFLQHAIDAAKHGASKHKEKYPITLNHILYGSNSGCYTVAIHKHKTLEMINMYWYSMSNVTVSDLVKKINNTNNGVDVIFDRSKLNLYSISSRTIMSALEGFIKEYTILNNYPNDFVIRTSEIESSFNTRKIRTGQLKCEVEDWTIYNMQDMCYTVFNGDKYQLLLGLCDVLFVTNANSNVRYTSKLDTYYTYMEYVSGSNKELILSIIMNGCDSGVVYDINNVSNSNPLKAMTTINQIHKLMQFSNDESVDELDSIESRLFVGREL